MPLLTVKYGISRLHADWCPPWISTFFLPSGSISATIIKGNPKWALNNIFMSSIKLLDRPNYSIFYWGDTWLFLHLIWMKSCQPQEAQELWSQHFLQHSLTWIVILSWSCTQSLTLYMALPQLLPNSGVSHELVCHKIKFSIRRIKGNFSVVFKMCQLNAPMKLHIL